MSALLRTFFIVVAASLGLSGCALLVCLIDTDVSRRPEYKNVAGHELITREKLYLHKPDNNGGNSERHLYVLERYNIGDSVLLAVIPAGHRIRVHKVIRQHTVEEYADHLYGEVTLHGTTYPLKHLVGISLTPNYRDELHDMFVIKE